MYAKKIQLINCGPFDWLEVIIPFESEFPKLPASRPSLTPVAK